MEEMTKKKRRYYWIAFARYEVGGTQEILGAATNTHPIEWINGQNEGPAQDGRWALLSWQEITREEWLMSSEGYDDDED